MVFNKSISEMKKSVALRTVWRFKPGFSLVRAKYFSENQPSPGVPILAELINMNETKSLKLKD